MEPGEQHVQLSWYSKVGWFATPSILAHVIVFVTSARSDTAILAGPLVFVAILLVARSLDRGQADRAGRTQLTALGCLPVTFTYVALLVAAVWAFDIT